MANKLQRLMSALALFTPEGKLVVDAVISPSEDPTVVITGDDPLEVTFSDPIDIATLPDVVVTTLPDVTIGASAPLDIATLPDVTIDSLPAITGAVSITGTPNVAVTNTPNVRSLGYNGSSYRVNAPIAAGATGLSAAISIASFAAKGGTLFIPSGWVAADLYFNAGFNGTDFFPVCNEFGQRIKITGIQTAEGRFYSIPPELWAHFCHEYLQLFSATNAATPVAVNQTGSPAIVMTFQI